MGLIDCAVHGGVPVRVVLKTLREDLDDDDEAIAFSSRHLIEDTP